MLCHARHAFEEAEDYGQGTVSWNCLVCFWRGGGGIFFGHIIVGGIIFNLSCIIRYHLIPILHDISLLATP